MKRKLKPEACILWNTDLCSPPPLITEIVVLPSFETFHSFIAHGRIEALHLTCIHLLAVCKSTFIFIQIKHCIKCQLLKPTSHSEVSETLLPSHHPNPFQPVAMQSQLQTSSTGDKQQDSVAWLMKGPSFCPSAP